MSLKVAIAGATGLLGKRILDAFLTLKEPVFDISVLTRKVGGTPRLDQTAKVLAVDYENHEELVKALQGQNILINVIGAANNVETDRKLLGAAIAAHVDRFFPSEFSLDVMHPAVFDVAANTRYGDKIRFARELEKASREGKIEYTTIVPGQFLDDGIAIGWLGFDIKDKKVTLYDGGEHDVTGCSLRFTAAAVVMAASMSGEEVRNKRLRVAEARYSGKEVVMLLEKVTGHKFEIVENVTSEESARRMENFTKEGDIYSAYTTAIKRLNYDGSGAGYFEDGLTWGGHSLARRSLEDQVKDAVKAVAEGGSVP